MASETENDFNNQIKCKTVNTILQKILYHRTIRFEEESKLLNEEYKIEDIEAKIKKEHFFFRGESSYHRFRTPSLYLQKNLTMEGSEYYYRFLLNELGRDDYTDNTSLVRLISELQHYGAKTRILDITRNPLIALYFAVEKEDNKPGFLFIYKSREEDEKFDTGYTVAIKSAMNLMPQKIIDDFLDTMNSIERVFGGDIPNRDLDEFDDLLSDESFRKDKEEHFSKVKSFMDLLNQRAKVREKLIYPVKIYKDLQKAHIVVPSKTNDRIKQQQGAFIYPKFVSATNSDYETIIKEISSSIEEHSGTIFTKKEQKGKQDSNNNNEHTDKVSFSVIKIDGGNKKVIRNQLEMLGITEGFVYPDIEHQSKALLEIINPQDKK